MTPQACAEIQQLAERATREILGDGRPSKLWDHTVECIAKAIAAGAALQAGDAPDLDKSAKAAIIERNAVRDVAFLLGIIDGKAITSADPSTIETIREFWSTRETGIATLAPRVVPAGGDYMLVERRKLERIAELDGSETGEPLDEAVSLARAMIAAAPRAAVVEECARVEQMREALSDIMLFIVDERNADPAEAGVHEWWRQHADTLKDIPRPGSSARDAMLKARESRRLAPSGSTEREKE